MLCRCILKPFGEMAHWNWCASLKDPTSSYQRDLCILAEWLPTQYLDRMIIYSVSQYGPGFPAFSRAVFEYICLGSISKSLPFLSIENIGDQRKYSLASQVIL